MVHSLVHGNVSINTYSKGPKLIPCSIMEGFDVVLINNFYALPQFARKYGEVDSAGKYAIPAKWQASLSNGAQVGEIIGLSINGWASERFGYKKTMIVAVSFVASSGVLSAR